MAGPEIALSVTTYQKPWHLRRALASIAGQRGVEGRMEVVVTDDGSTDETPAVVEEFRRRVGFPLLFTTHEHLVYHPSRSRNDGARATGAPYILFIDGDCVLPPDHVAIHLAHRKPGSAMLGDCHRADEALSATLSEVGAERGDFLEWNLDEERRRINRRHFKHRLYTFVRHSRKPKLVSNNVGIWRSDFERVNGFDENFKNWGAEDDDLGRRLRRAGVRLESIMPYTRLVHLWHPRETSITKRWRDGANAPYFLRPAWLTRCRNGLTRRPLGDLKIGVAGRPARPEQAEAICRQAGLDAKSLFSLDPAAASRFGRAEVELLFLPGEGRFSGAAECQVLVVLDAAAVSSRLLKNAQRIAADRTFPDRPPEIQFPLSEFARALDSIV
ncbi:MAG TPA: galactosyltransferase-related protein [Pirellulales bacterium]|nr:galactosyltransferase-related protein [Pirellulales bacterium]